MLLLFLIKNLIRWRKFCHNYFPVMTLISLEIFVFNARLPSLKGIWLQGLEDMGIEKDDLVEIVIESVLQRKYYYIFI